jgi:hypothetical protein
MTDSFWTGGPNAYADGIKAEHEAKLSKLNAALVDCEDEHNKRSIEQEILTIKAQFKEKFNGNDSLIF